MMTGFSGNILLIVYILVLLVQALAGIYFLRLKRIFPAWYKWLYAAGALVLGSVFFTLLFFFATANYQYHQVWMHVSEKLPLYYRIAAMWEGQEGSFLLWAFIQSCAGLILVFNTNPDQKAASVIFCFLQLFLVIPLVSFPFGGTYLFESTIQALGISGQTLSAQWLLESGRGLNPLLQNFWMTIHPPCIFTAFAFGSISFSIVVTNILRDDYSWLKNGLIWLKVSLLFLSPGILMGAYWAYETLNFGGYWSWDPVENAIYIPWVIGIGAMHIGWVARKYHKHIGLAAVLSLLYFVFIVYSTFLTRSGILQNTSVHSFVDDGYRNLLIVYLLSIVFAAGTSLVFQRKKLFFSSERIHLQSRQDWLLIVAIVFLLASFHVFVNTSIPVLNSFLRFFHIDSNLAPPATTMMYSVGQGIFAIGLAGVLVIVEKGRSFRSVIFAIVSVGVGIAISSGQKNIQLSTIISMLLITLSCVLFLLLVRNVFMQVRARKISGSWMSHAGFALLIAGIVLSGKELSATRTPAHIYLGYGEDVAIGDRTYRYAGKFLAHESGDHIDTKLLKSTFRIDRFLAKDTIEINKKKFLPGAVVAIHPQTSFFKITDLSESKSSFSSVYFENPNSYFVSPVIQRGLTKDTYIHVSNFQDHEKLEWKKWDELNFYPSLRMDSGDTASIIHVQELQSFPGLYLSERRKAFMVHVVLNNELSSASLAPVVVLEEGKPPVFLEDTDVNAGVLAVISLWNNEHDFKIDLMRSEKSWVTIRHEEKPFINLFWFGGLLMIAGMGISLQNRRYRQLQNSPGKKEPTANTTELLTENEIV